MTKSTRVRARTYARTRAGACADFYGSASRPTVMLPPPRISGVFSLFHPPKHCVSEGDREGD